VGGPSWERLMIGKKELCALSEKDVENTNLINRIRNNSRSSFDAMRKIIQTQSELRQANLSRKRQRSKQSSQISQSSLDLEVSSSTQVTFGSHIISLFDGRSLFSS
jgi:hypothetical protein